MAVLSRMTEEQITKGVTKVLEAGSVWVPVLPEFVAMCMPETISPTGTNSEAYKLFESDLKIESDETKEKRKYAGQSALNDMKDLF